MIFWSPWSEVKAVHSCLTLCNPMDYTVHGILQARILEWVTFPFSRGLPNPRIELRSPTLQANSLPAEPPGKPWSTYPNENLSADNFLMIKNIFFPLCSFFFIFRLVNLQFLLIISHHVLLFLSQKIMLHAYWIEASCFILRLFMFMDKEKLLHGLLQV